MNSRERITAILNLDEPDRIGFYDWFWAETIERWKKEGMPSNYAAEPYVWTHWGYGAFLDFPGLGPEIRGVGCDISPRFPTTTIDLTARSKIVRDEWGVKQESFIESSGFPHVVEPAIQTLEDFKERIEPCYYPDDASRVYNPNYPFKGDMESIIKRMQKKYFITVNLIGAWEYVRHILGPRIDFVLIKLMKDPVFMSYTVNFLGDIIARSAKAFIDLGVDGLFYYEDLGYKNGPFFAPEIFRKLLQPIHKQITAPFRKRGLPTILHCCGGVKLLVQDLIDSGWTALNPLEVKAGMDVIDLKERFGDKLAFIGNIDVRTLALTPQKIEEEVRRKIAVAAQGGGYIIGSDHSVPYNVSYENYTFFLNLVRKYGNYPLR